MPSAVVDELCRPKPATRGHTFENSEVGELSNSNKDFESQYRATSLGVNGLGTCLLSCRIRSFKPNKVEAGCASQLPKLQTVRILRGRIADKDQYYFYTHQ